MGEPPRVADQLLQVGILARHVATCGESGPALQGAP
jgi:hypothetical protein